jgi:biopolymer transport protein ExbD
MAAGAGRGEEDAITGINVVPLVDIVLVLLIIFMMTASIIVAPSVKIELPTVSKADQPPPRNLHFVMDVTGAIYLDDRRIEKQEILPLVKQRVAENPDVQVLVSADKQVPYGDVVEVLDLVREGGVTKFAISVEVIRKRS